MFELKSYSTRFAMMGLLIATIVTGQAIGQVPNPADNGRAGGTTTQTVNAQQAGPWTVGIDPAKNLVQLGNSDANPLAVKIIGSGAGRRPFQTRVVVTIPAGSGVAHTTIGIPSGKRMIIENVSALARGPQGVEPFMQFLTYFDNGDTFLDAQDIAYHRVVLAPQYSSSGNTTSTANHKVLVFSDERVAAHYNLGLTVSFGLTQIVSQPATAEITFSGYFEDLPTAQ